MLQTAEVRHASVIEDLLSAFVNRTATIGVVGLGYVGLPLAEAVATSGYRVLGFDTDPGKIAHLSRGEPYLRHFGEERVKALVAGTFSATVDLSRLGEADVITICVPTPLTKHREPDLSFVEATAKAVASCLRPGQLVVLESTTYPGTTTEVVKPILEATGLRSGEDFFLAFSPEREDPGNAAFATSAIPKVLGADGILALSAAEALYRSVFSSIVTVSSPGAAEATKLTENIFRAVNIALVNELKVIFSEMGIDVWEVIDAAKTKPFGFMPFYPGPGLGGHCIPIDPFYLTWKAREYGIATRFIELAGEINTAMPQRLVERVADVLSRRLQKSLNGARILLLGLAYKKNVDDVRESPALRIMELLDERGSEVSFFDPFVASIPPTREHPSYTGRPCIALTPTSLDVFDCAVVVTDHDDVDYALVAKHVPLIMDSRNVFARQGLPLSNVVKV